MCVFIVSERDLGWSEVLVIVMGEDKIIRESVRRGKKVEIGS